MNISHGEEVIGLAPGKLFGVALVYRYRIVDSSVVKSIKKLVIIVVDFIYFVALGDILYRKLAGFSVVLVIDSKAKLRGLVAFLLRAACRDRCDYQYKDTCKQYRRKQMLAQPDTDGPG